MTMPPETSPPASRSPLKRRAFLKRGAKIFAALCVPGAAAWSRFGEPSFVETTHRTLLLPRLAPAFDGFTLAQISDIHVDEGMTAAHLEAVVSRVNALGAEAVALTGDFLSSCHPAKRENRANALRALAKLRAPQGKFAVLGNHDYWTDAALVRRHLAKAGIVELPNAVHTLRRGAQMLHFAGVDDLWAGQNDLPRVLASLPQDGAAILLMHEPDFADQSAASGRFDLQISGHSHGGQVRLPFLGAPFLPQFARKYPVGLYQIGTMWQYTNRGIGTTRVALRFGCRPEITHFTLRAGAAI